MGETLYFFDNFFSSGKTDIYTEQKAIIGYLDLKSAFSEGVNILDENGNLLLRGYTPFFSNKWNIVDPNETTVGILRERFALFQKSYEYQADNGETFTIESEAFSRDYTIIDTADKVACNFKRVDGFFESPAFQLTNFSETIPSTEWIAVVMGVNAIQKRRRNNAAAT
ncbi:hypothetical protein [Ornithinibacillus sp. 179-J 7C1 HS]|uniref:hypothetical protein n=1 Tax=Ornithinibacillus sp. 179-J 7C1 HS TaxID=3142384 RepID=UPI00399FBC76